MGLISKLKSVGGQIKSNASSLAGKILGKAKKPAVATIGKLSSAAKSAAPLAMAVAKKHPAIAVAASVAALSKGISVYRERKAKREGVTQKEKKSIIPTVAKVAMAGGLAAAVAVGAEKVAEVAGVRGGAGFVGERPARRRKKKRKSSRRRTSSCCPTRRRKKSGKRVSFTTKDGRRVSFSPGRRSKKKRRGRITASEFRGIERLLRKEMRD